MQRVRHETTIGLLGALLALLLLGGFLAACWAVLAHVEILRSSSFIGVTQFTAVLTLFSALVIGVLFMVAVFAAVTGLVSGRALSPLIWPLLAVITCLAAVLGTVGVSSLDRLMHDLQLTWGFQTDPDNRAFGAVLYLGLTLSLAWLAAVWLDGQGMRRRYIAVLLATIAAAGSAAVLVAVWV
jgi:hypothetical protein